MFFIFPIGSEAGVRRLPYFTIGLIAVNTIIWFITSSILSGQERALQEVNEKLLEIESRYVYRLVETDPTFLQEHDLDTVHEKFFSDEIIPQDSRDYEDWYKLYEDYEVKRSSLVFEQLGFIPKKFDFFKLFTSVFVHAGFFHLLFNMLFLWLVGCNIEDDWSWKVFLGLYFVSGAVACLFHALAFPDSKVPLVGASGAIAGVMGAFMVRHYKTKVRFAYFIWFFLTRPFFGTFAVYAGIAFPLWFLMQITCASWSVETGTAYWAHIGGFIFGAAVSTTFRFLGVEKKYIAPMVEDSFEQLKVSPKMKEVNKKLNMGDTVGAIPLLLALINEEPDNADAPLMLARVYFEKGHHNDAILMYNKALEVILRKGDVDVMLSTYEETKEKNLLNKLSEKNVFNSATFLERQEKYEDAAKLYVLYFRVFPQGKVRPKAIYRTYIIFKDKLKNEKMALNALELLKKEYPEFPITS